ncbi:MAG: NAD(P)H-quinone oxidoreductase [Bacteroidota bacterium]
MKAIQIDKPGGPEGLYIGEFPRPEPAAHEILVKVAATALNRADTMQREGRYPPPPGASPIMGLEMAGTVVGMGSQASRWKEGDQVCGLLPGGGYAEYVVIHEDVAMPVTENMELEMAAGLPEVFMTAYQAMFWLGELKEGETVLLHAGASGVGTAGIQMAKAKGAHVWVTASAGKHEACLSLGADKCIDYKAEDFSAFIQKEHPQKGVNLIVDPIGGAYFPKNLDVMLPDGKLVVLAFMGGMISEINLAKILIKRLRVQGSTLRARDLAYKIRLAQDLQKDFGAAFSSGEIKPVIDSLYDWSDVQEAHRYIEANKNIGKIILKIND